MSLLNLKQLITNILKENKLEDGLSQGSYPVTDRKVIGPLSPTRTTPSW